MTIEGWPWRLWFRYRWGRIQGWLGVGGRKPTAYTDPQDRWRLIRVSTDLLSQFGTRTEGVYEPTFTMHRDDDE